MAGARFQSFLNIFTVAGSVVTVAWQLTFVNMDADATLQMLAQNLNMNVIFHP